MSIVVVPIALEHAASFREALGVVARERRYLAMVEAPPLEQAEAFVRLNLEQGVPQVVALQQEASRVRVVGWADIVPGSRGMAHRGSLGMGVLPGHRGQGLGRRLLQACLERAWARGLTRVELEVRADNAAAIRLYESAGFQREGVRRRGLVLDGAAADTLQMGLLAEDVPAPVIVPVPGATPLPGPEAMPVPTTASMPLIAWDDFVRVELRVGRVVAAEPFPQARRPAYRLQVDFGPGIGLRKSSAQITALYRPEDLVGRQVVAVVNFPPKQIGPMRSECLVTGFHDAEGRVSLCRPDHEVPLGARLL